MAVLLENSEIIQKWQYILERKNGNEINSENLGLFLRLLHYYCISLIETESESMMLQCELKICTTLLNVTPYARMLPGLSA